MSDDKNRIDLTDLQFPAKDRSDEMDRLIGNLHTCVHIRGFNGDDGENEGVLCVSANRRMSENYPSCAAIVVGSPQSSPLVPGYIPDLGGFSCSVEAAKRLIAELQAAVAIVEAGCREAAMGSDRFSWDLVSDGDTTRADLAACKARLADAEAELQTYRSAVAGDLDLERWLDDRYAEYEIGKMARELLHRRSVDANVIRSAVRVAVSDWIAGNTPNASAGERAIASKVMGDAIAERVVAEMAP